jgi:hypothetical protein
MKNNKKDAYFGAEISPNFAIILGRFNGDSEIAKIEHYYQDYTTFAS